MDIAIVLWDVQQDNKVYIWHERLNGSYGTLNEQKYWLYVQQPHHITVFDAFSLASFEWEWGVYHFSKCDDAAVDSTLFAICDDDNDNINKGNMNEWISEVLNGRVPAIYFFLIMKWGGVGMRIYKVCRKFCMYDIMHLKIKKQGL